MACSRGGVDVVAPVARRGVLDLGSWDFARFGPVELSGEWSVAWEQFAPPEAAPPGDLFVLPDMWNGHRVGGSRHGADGFATFFLQVLLPRERPHLALRFGTLGSAAEMHDARERSVAFQLFLAGAVLVMGLYHLSLAFTRREDRTALHFGLFCLAIGTYGSSRVSGSWACSCRISRGPSGCASRTWPPSSPCRSSCRSSRPSTRRRSHASRFGRSTSLPPLSPPSPSRRRPACSLRSSLRSTSRSSAARGSPCSPWPAPPSIAAKAQRCWTWASGCSWPPSSMTSCTTTSSCGRGSSWTSASSCWSSPRRCCSRSASRGRSIRSRCRGRTSRPPTPPWRARSPIAAERRPPSRRAKAGSAPSSTT